jgi:hypothetical protein
MMTLGYAKGKIVQILFLQIHQNCAKYTLETFTIDGITIAYRIESIACNKNVLHKHNFSEKPLKK